MKNRESDNTVQSAYLLEYGRRKIRVCADTFQNLAQIFAEDRDEEEEQERTVLFLRKSLAKERSAFLAGNLKEMAAMMNRAAEESVRFIRLGSRRQKQLVRGLAGEGLNLGDGQGGGDSIGGGKVVPQQGRQALAQASGFCHENCSFPEE